MKPFEPEPYGIYVLDICNIFAYFCNFIFQKRSHFIKVFICISTEQGPVCSHFLGVLLEHCEVGTENYIEFKLRSRQRWNGNVAKVKVKQAESVSLNSLLIYDL